MLTSSQVRDQFIDYFVQRHAHAAVPSSPVLPHDDPTLLFANAGMNQFKDVFLGTGSRPYTRAANTQKCIRAGGKHNDLEDVGRDTYHHTFFEMLGNWSFGDYFKKEAITWAWDLLTNVWGLEKDRLYATVFAGDAGDGLEPDSEAAELWRTQTDIDPTHILTGDKEDNFWEMGEVGPCGPCSEVHIDLTPDKSGGKLVNAGDARVIEIWNLVFIQFNRAQSVPGQPGKLTPLPAQHVDTGMGFERVCAVLQGKTSNYDTDVFSPLFDAIRDVSGARAYGGAMEDRVDIAYRVIADHIRCLTFALTDGAVPSNEGRGYVLRRILRRAVRHGRQTLGIGEPYLHRLVAAVVEPMQTTFPELGKDPQSVVELIKDEEESFGRTLGRGIELFEQAAERGKSQRIEAVDAFKLHDTYGFPLDLTQVMAEERGMTVDVEGFDRLMEQARVQARSSGGGRDLSASMIEAVQRDQPPDTDFIGYDQTQSDVETFCYLYRINDGGLERVDRSEAGEELAVVVGHTPFYAESGGQIGDTGEIRNMHGGVFRVHDTVKVGGVHFHVGVTEEGELREAPPGEADLGTELTFSVDAERRSAIMANHTGTHLMNKALRDALGDHVQQRGSLVDDDKLRFDFSHTASLHRDQIDQIEKAVNQDIDGDLSVYAEVAGQDEALQINGLRAVFGEKYPPRVRVVSIGVPVPELIANPGNDDWETYSVEFCGGTHVAKTGDIKGFTVISEEAVGKGVRRVTALTGRLAHQATARSDALLAKLDATRKMPVEQLPDAIVELTNAATAEALPILTAGELRVGIVQLQQKVKEQDKQRSKEVAGSAVEAARQLAEQSNGQVIVDSIDGADANALRSAMDVIRKKCPDAAMLLGTVNGGKVIFVASVPKELIQRGLKAGDWVREVAKAAGGGGGGRPDMAQAGGKDPAKLDEALEVGRSFATSKL